jgi:hypothetical protein
MVPTSVCEQVPVTVEQCVARRVLRPVTLQQCVAVPVTAPACLTCRDRAGLSGS